jgi:hypothetical protein
VNSKDELNYIHERLDKLDAFLGVSSRRPVAVVTAPPPPTPKPSPEVVPATSGGANLLGVLGAILDRLPAPPAPAPTAVDTTENSAAASAPPVSRP